MIEFEIDKKYNIPESWEELTLERYEAFCIWQKANIPDSLDFFYKELEQKPGEGKKERQKRIEKVLEKADHKEWFKFKQRSVQFFANIPEDVIMNIKVADVEAFYVQFLQEFILGYYYPPEFNEVQEFEFDGKTYKAPESADDIFGNLIPGRNMTARQYFESAEIMNAGRKLEQGQVEGVALMISIIYSEETEEEKIKKTAKELKKLNMKTVWGCSFFFDRLKVTYMVNTLMQAARGEIRRSKQE